MGGVDWAIVMRSMVEGGPDSDVSRMEVINDILSDGCIDTLLPEIPPHPPGEIQGLISAIRTKDWERVESLRVLDDVAKRLGQYRLEITECEARNSKRLERLAWCIGECRRISVREPDAVVVCRALDAKLVRIAAQRWGVDGVSEERGWASATCLRRDLLPVAARYL